MGKTEYFNDDQSMTYIPIQFLAYPDKSLLLAGHHPKKFKGLSGISSSNQTLFRKNNC